MTGEPIHETTPPDHEPEVVWRALTCFTVGCDNHMNTIVYPVYGVRAICGGCSVDFPSVEPPFTAPAEEGEQ